MDTSERYIPLNAGAHMPVVGLGTWQSPRDKAGDAVEYALGQCGYTHIDCAWIYGNEKEIGASFKRVFDRGSVKRKDIFITSKLWNSFHSNENVSKACKETLADLGLEYLDLYLIHWGLSSPAGKDKEPLDERGVLRSGSISIRETWEAMQELVQARLVKAIGVSNFTVPMLTDLLSYAKIVPAVNQVELHPYLQQERLLEFCGSKGIAVTAYSPLGRPGAEPPRSHMELPGQRLVDDATIVAIASQHGKTPAQTMIRWAIQRGTVVIPKSVTPARIKENIAVFDFELSDDDMKKISALDKRQRLVDPYDWWKIPYFN